VRITLAEVETDKVTVEIPPTSGILSKILVPVAYPRRLSRQSLDNGAGETDGEVPVKSVAR